VLPIIVSKGLDYLLGKVLGRPRSVAVAQTRMLLITCIFSAFVNDTPVVCIMLPIVTSWVQRARLPAKQVSQPFASVLQAVR
jgi:Na+/H+ antiporter NhaD/arsenite permease-like protein